MCYPSKYQRTIEQAILSVSIIILTSKIASRLTVVKFPLFAKQNVMDTKDLGETKRQCSKDKKSWGEESSHVPFLQPLLLYLVTVVP